MSLLVSDMAVVTVNESLSFTKDLHTIITAVECMMQVTGYKILYVILEIAYSLYFYLIYLGI